MVRGADGGGSGGYGWGGAGGRGGRGEGWSGGRRPAGRQLAWRTRGRALPTPCTSHTAPPRELAHLAVSLPSNGLLTERSSVRLPRQCALRQPYYTLRRSLPARSQEAGEEGPDSFPDRCHLARQAWYCTGQVCHGKQDPASAQGERCVAQRRVALWQQAVRSAAPA